MICAGHWRAKGEVNGMEQNRKEITITHAEERRDLDLRINQQCERLNRYLDDNLTDPSLCLVSVADHMNLSIYAVSRLVKRTAGRSFRAFITQKRLELAFDLLQSSEASVREIARRVGFENPAYFSSIFKKHYGFSPISVKRDR